MYLDPMGPILPILSILGYWAIILGSVGGSGILFWALLEVQVSCFGLFWRFRYIHVCTYVPIP